MNLCKKFPAGNISHVEVVKGKVFKEQGEVDRARCDAAPRRSCYINRCDVTRRDELTN